MTKHALTFVWQRRQEDKKTRRQEDKKTRRQEDKKTRRQDNMDGKDKKDELDKYFNGQNFYYK